MNMNKDKDKSKNKNNGNGDIQTRDPKDLIQDEDTDDDIILEAVKTLLSHENDTKGYTKTDIPTGMVSPLSHLVSFAKNPTPMLNKYYERNNVEKHKLDIPMIHDEFIDDFVKLLVSRERLGREEATDIIKSIRENQPDEGEGELTQLEKLIQDKSL